MQTDAEHQENHAHFGKLAGQLAISDEARREWTYHDAGDEKPDERRQAQAIGDVAEHRREYEAHGYGGDQSNLMIHSIPLDRSHISS